MHPTRDTQAVKILNRAGGRVMRGVGRLSVESDVLIDKPLR